MSTESAKYRDLWVLEVGILNRCPLGEYVGECFCTYNAAQCLDHCSSLGGPNSYTLCDAALVARYAGWAKP